MATVRTILINSNFIFAKFIPVSSELYFVCVVWTLCVETVQ